MDALTKWSATAVAEAKPRLSFRRLALLSLGGLLALAAAGYGYNWHFHAMVHFQICGLSDADAKHI